MIYVRLEVHKLVCYGTLTDEKVKVLKRGKFSSDQKVSERAQTLDYVDGVFEV
ncbi:MAG: hypothetical protein ABSA11_16365 [Candidatus Bathyarchaeia archaeon]|jgi:hypothetical protein